MWLKRCHSPISMKPMPGATCPTRVPIIDLEGIIVCE